MPKAKPAKKVELKRTQVAKRILVVGAHPDDIEFGCGGLLVKESKAGNVIRMVCLTSGEAGSSGTSAERRQESKDAAKAIGATIEFPDFGGDCHVEPTVENKVRIARIIREFKPHVVLAPHTLENQHPDHRNAGIITRDACRFARYGGLKELKGTAVHVVGALYYYLVTGHNLHPDIIVDVSDVMGEWDRVMKMHKTQVRSRAYLDFVHSRARTFGLMGHSEYGLGLWTDDPVFIDCVCCLERTARHF